MTAHPYATKCNTKQPFFNVLQKGAGPLPILPFKAKGPRRRAPGRAPEIGFSHFASARNYTT